METRTIFALKADDKHAAAVMASLSQGVGRFGWSYVATADLHRLTKIIDEQGREALSEAERDCYQAFLLELKPDDYVVYVNLPEWGKCTLARVVGGYYWEEIGDDFNHCFKIDPASVATFSRNDAIVHPTLGARLKLMGRYWRIYSDTEFDSLLVALGRGEQGIKGTVNGRMKLLAGEARPHLAKITEAIHHTHPNFDLEKLLEVLFRRMPGVREVRTAHGVADVGADLIVVTEQAHPLTGQIRQSTVLVQVKSYKGVHDDPGAVKALRKAFAHYPDATEAMIISTASSRTETLDKAVEALRVDMGRPVAIMMGEDLAAFVLRYGWDLLR
jgi:restriction endonuclease